jgi:hypothetical protein
MNSITYFLRASIFSLLFIFISSSTKASHHLGSEITWTCLGQDSFLVSLTIYRDCNGIMNNSATIKVACEPSKKYITSLNIQNPTIIDITPVCDNSCTRCQSSGCSFPYGIEKYTYENILVFDNSVSCCKVRLSYYDCCRSNTITTGMASQNAWNEAILDRCVSPCNSSPVFNNTPIMIICIGQDFRYSPNITNIDSINGIGDSLSFEWVYPRGSGGSNLIYSGSYDYNKPINFWGFPNANLPSPRGFHLDPYNGEIAFRPMKVEQTVMALKVSEFRNGNLIGEVTRDFTIIVISCPNNQAPLLSGPFYKEVCAGSTVEFQIRTMDYDPYDTLTISWDSTIAGAIWTDDNGHSKHPTGILQWTPQEKFASNVPYNFTVTVKDNACPIYSTSTRNYRILVKPRPQAEIIKVDSGCYDYHFRVIPIYGAAPSYQWIGNFNQGFYYDSSRFHYKFNNPGQYPYSMTMTSGTGTTHCSRTYNDTIFVDSFLSFEPFKIEEACYNDLIRLKAKYKYNKSSIKYQWSTHPNDTFDEKQFYIKSDTTIRLTISDSTLCAFSDSAFIKMNELPIVNLGKDTMLKKGDVLILDAGNGFIKYQWSDNSTNQRDTIRASIFNNGDYEYWVKVTDSNRCVNSDTIIVTINHVGIDENNSFGFLKLYPNPSYGKFTLEVENPNNQEMNISIFNQEGKTVYHRFSRELHYVVMLKA